jgi:biopolymer transport protein TolQ
METTGLNVLAAGTDLSMSQLFMQAGMVVKIVMMMLIFASVWSWAIIFEKWLKLGQLKFFVKKFEEKFWSGGSLDELFQKVGNAPKDPMSAIFVAAMREWKRANVTVSFRAKTGVSGASLQQRIERAMQITLDREIDRLETRMIFLASTGAVSPFVGLFGTVWGIMSSFHSIGMTQNTSLAVVAPGIAEALFATALGLIAAIPAVIAYNKLSTDIDRFAKTLENFAGEFATILSRQLDDTTSNIEESE